MGLKRTTGKKKASGAGSILFEAIKAIDDGEYGFYATTSGAKRKELDKLLAYPMLRWISGAHKTDDCEFTTIAVNEVANQNYFTFGKHPELQFKLLCVAGARKWIKHAWISIPGTAGSSRVIEAMTSIYPFMKNDDAYMWLELNGRIEYEYLMNANGVQKADLKTLMKEFDKVFDENGTIKR